MTTQGGLRDGYALLAVLWICVGVGGLGMVISAAARDATTTSRNRIELIRAEWRADGCIARARAVLSGAMRDEAMALNRPASSAWIRADQTLAASPVIAGQGCALVAAAVGARLDVNSADEGMLSDLFERLGQPSERADSLAAAISDWKDTDDTPRASGAEREWYERSTRPGPANRPFRTLAELRLVRGMDAFPDVVDVLDVEPGAVSINHAPPEVLAVLPGLSPDIVEWLVVRRRRYPLRTYADLSDGLSVSAGEAVAEALPRLAPLVTFEPEAWVLTVHARGGNPAVAVTVEVRLEKAGSSVRVMRRRAWIP